jgi:hypothetical protein
VHFVINAADEKNYEGAGINRFAINACIHNLKAFSFQANISIGNYSSACLTLSFNMLYGDAL